MSAGYTGKILKLDLTNKATGIIDTEQYEEWGGGASMGTAVFWDECEDVTVSGFDTKNVICIMSNPMAATLAPSAGRTDLCGINVFSYPKEWFTRSNSGSRFGPMLRLAGWDGIVIKGASDTPVWVNIIDDKVTIEDATDLWGMDTHATRDEIWLRVTGRYDNGGWLEMENGFTTQGPAVMVIGQAGENLSRQASIQNSPNGGFSQGGFGAVWGTKNLKAISAVGTGSIEIADPNALVAARNYVRQDGYFPGPGNPTAMPATGRLGGCFGCAFPCKGRSRGGANDAQCLTAMCNMASTTGMAPGSYFLAKYGINGFEPVSFNTPYIVRLYNAGLAGPGMEIDTGDLPVDQYGTSYYYEGIAKAIALREGIGDMLAEGDSRFAEAIGRYDEDIASGLLARPQWGYDWHWSLPETSFAFGSLLGARDTDEHCWQYVGSAATRTIGEENLPAEQCVEILATKTPPYTGDVFMFDYSHTYDTGIYSEHNAKFIAWHRHYTRYYKQGMGMCDWMWPQFLSTNTSDYSGVTGIAEPMILNAITGKNMTFEDGIEVGRKVWNLNRAILALQGRHRDDEKFAPYMYTDAGTPTNGFVMLASAVTVYKDGEWTWDQMADEHLDEDGVEQFKTHYYNFEGWDPETGYPSRSTLEGLDLGSVADTLESAGKLGDTGEYTGA